jgi:CelD/BcsL family acetyltransferase involved in cellulose biosynthesis
MPEDIPNALADRDVVVRIEVFDDVSRVMDVWRALAPEGSFYQSETFLLAWLGSFGARAKVRPYFIVARDARGEALALLPFGLFRFGALRVAQCLGGKHANYNLGLFRAGAAFSAGDLRALLRAAAARPGGPHLFRLLNLPLLWNGEPNPLALAPHHPAASGAYATHLPADGEAFLAARLSADARKKWRKKEKRLAAMGALHWFRAESTEQINHVLDAFFAQKQALGAGHVAPADAAATRAFYRALADGPDMELHALALDDRIVAVFGAGRCGARLQGMFISYDSDPEIARSSPGELLLGAVVRDACARGFSAFDLGVGEARYKRLFCEETESMVEALFAPTLTGALAAPIFALAARTKRAIKASPRLHALTKRALGR